MTIPKHQTRHRPIGLAVVLALGCTAAAVAAPATVSLPGDRFYPESITSTSDGTLYVGSFAEGGIVRVHPGADHAEWWIKPGTFNTRSILGVLADEAPGTLWACSNDLSMMGVAGPGDAEGSTLVAFDLKTGEGKFSAKLPNEHSLCNDITIGPDKAAYVTNSFAPEILRLAPGGKQLEVWATDTNFDPPKGGAGLDGLAFGDDGTLYTNTYSEGKLLKVEVRNGKPGAVTLLKPSQPVGLTDAIKAAGGGAFLMIEGTGKLDRVTYSSDTAKIETLKTGFSTPTGVTKAGAVAWVSEGQLPHLLDPKMKDQPPSLPFKLYAVDLNSQ